MSAYLLLIAGTEAMMLMACGIILFVVVYQKRLVRQQEEKQQIEMSFQREMNKAGILVAESERRRIATDLHDDIGHDLLSLRMQLRSNGSISETNRIIDRTIEKVRHIAYELYPPGLNMFGLAHALGDLFTEIRAVTNVEIDSELEAFPSGLGPEKELAIYRIVQELLSNTIRYAGATCITFHVTHEAGELVMNYTDNGCGFDRAAKEKGLGLLNIRNRALAAGATLQLETSPGKGFRAQLQLPTTTPE